MTDCVMRAFEEAPTPADKRAVMVALMLQLSVKLVAAGEKPEAAAADFLVIAEWFARNAGHDLDSWRAWLADIGLTAADRWDEIPTLKTGSTH